MTGVLAMPGYHCYHTNVYTAPESGSSVLEKLGICKWLGWSVLCHTACITHVELNGQR